jgi:hypothetical protein
MLTPEVQGEYGGGKQQKPDHGISQLGVEDTALLSSDSGHQVGIGRIECLKRTNHPLLETMSEFTPAASSMRVM